MNQLVSENYGRRASILLETILALLFAVMTISAVAGLLSTSMRRVRQADKRVRAMLLAENKLAELKTGLLDASKSDTGVFVHPANFSWSYEYDPTEIPQLKQLIITIAFDDPEDGFEYKLHSLFCPTLHLDSSQLRQLATDPAQLQSLAGGTGFFDIIGYAELFPGGENLLNVFLAGGVPAMTELFNKLVTGQIDPQKLMETNSADEEQQSLTDILTQSTGKGSSKLPPVWSDYDTAGIGSPPRELRSREGIAEETKTGEGNKPSSSEERLTTGRMTRQQALQKIQEMLRRLATHRK